MGQKVHPIGFRLGISKDWQAKWYADKNYTALVQEDLRIRKAIETRYGTDDISRVEIERSANQVTVTVYTARPGIIIGRGGQRVDEMRKVLEKIAGKRVRLNILEVAQPELDAYLVARSIAQQIERRISHRRAMKQAIARAMERGAQGIKITCAGRLSGSEYARKETLHQGRVPLHTLRADIDYEQAEAHTTLGRTGVKVWIYKGDITSEAEGMFMEGSLLSPPEERAADAGEEVAVGEKIESDEAEAAKKRTLDTDTEAQELSEASEIEAGAKEEVQAEKAPEAEAAEKPKPRAKSKAKTEKEPEAEAAEKPKPKVKAKAKAEKEPEAEAAEKPKPRAKAKTKAEKEPEAEEAEKPKPKAKAKTKAEKEPEAEEAEKPKPKAKAKTKAEKEPEESGES